MERRLVRVTITLDLLSEWLTNGTKIIGAIQVKNGIPPDAQFFTSRFDESNMCVSLFFSHPTFENLEAGMVIPELAPIITNLRVPEADEIYRKAIENG